MAARAVILNLPLTYYFETTATLWLPDVNKPSRQVIANAILNEAIWRTRAVTLNLTLTSYFEYLLLV